MDSGAGQKIAAPGRTGSQYEFECGCGHHVIVSLPAANSEAGGTQCRSRTGCAWSPGERAASAGYIQHTASMAGILTSHGNAPYAATKHAVVGLAEWLSTTYHDKGIRVHLLAPLGVRTPMLGDQVDSEWARAAAGPLREPEEVAQQVTDPIAQDWMEFKTNEPEKWLRGMRKLQVRLEQAGEAGAEG
ncbi:MAG: SDR family oxidoreductase [Actinomycetia bacterium]|nr:SDR family oxidoreductase [Actinomycetes bacterium]